MSLLGQSRQSIIEQFRHNESDTGSTEVQVALLTMRINSLAQHFKTHAKDHHSRRGLLKMVSSRRRLLSHFKRTRYSDYLSFVERVGLRK